MHMKKNIRDPKYSNINREHVFLYATISTAVHDSNAMPLSATEATLKLMLTFQRGEAAKICSW